MVRIMRLPRHIGHEGFPPVVSRAAPQLNLFAVGFPAAMLFGFAILLLSLPVLEGPFLRLIEEGFETAARSVGAR